MLSIVYDVSGNLNSGLVSVSAIIAFWSASNWTARLVKLTVFAYGETEAKTVRMASSDWFNDNPCR